MEKFEREEHKNISISNDMSPLWSTACKLSLLLFVLEFFLKLKSSRPSTMTTLNRLLTTAFFMSIWAATLANELLSPNNLIEDEIHFEIKWPGALLNLEDVGSGHCWSKVDLVMTFTIFIFSRSSKRAPASCCT